ncbi:MAG: PEGA domain-containing protein [Burkholderiales bacterium]|nr:PEGA domain-containing protein [Phycisphaerae bacterium]
MNRSIPLVLFTAGALLTGCVERKMTITSDPPESLVFMNGREVGRTPIERDFVWYGDYDVQVRKEGYDTLKTTTPVNSPWWQIPPIDLIAEFMPWHPTDHQQIHYTLQPSQSVDTPPEVLIDRAGELKGKLESSRVK